MSQLKCPIDYIPLQQVTAANLNAHVNNAELQAGAVNEQTAIGGPIASGDEFIVYDASVPALRKVTTGDILSADLPITASSYTAGSGNDITITPNDSTTVAGSTYTSSDGLTVTVTTLAAHGLSVNQVVLISTATNTGYNGTFRVTSASSLSFQYVMKVAATIGTGTLTFTKKGLISNPGNESIAGNLYVGGTQTLDGNLTVEGTVRINSTDAIKIPVGTSAERPAIPEPGHLRYNSTLSVTEMYTGTEWKAVGGLPFDSSGGTVTTVGNFKIHTYTQSGIFVPSQERLGFVEALIVGGGGNGTNGAGGGSAPGGNGGAGGEVKFTAFYIPVESPPFAVTVGTTGMPSSFNGVTANGGATGGGSAGFNNFSNLQYSHSCVGSNISGAFVNYGGNGGGGSGYSGTSTYGHIAYGGGGDGGGRYGPAQSGVANTGGGGGGAGSGGQYTGSIGYGAAGIVIIRYRIS